MAYSPAWRCFHILAVSEPAIHAIITKFKDSRHMLRAAVIDKWAHYGQTSCSREVCHQLTMAIQHCRSNQRRQTYCYSHDVILMLLNSLSARPALADYDAPVGLITISQAFGISDLPVSPMPIGGRSYYLLCIMYFQQLQLNTMSNVLVFS